MATIQVSTLPVFSRDAAGRPVSVWLDDRVVSVEYAKSLNRAKDPDFWPDYSPRRLGRAHSSQSRSLQQTFYRPGTREIGKEVA